MNLSTKQFGEIMRTLELSKRVSENDHRRATRVAQHGTVVVLLLADAGATESDRSKSYLTMSVRDISTRGIGLVHASPLINGRQFVVYLTNDQSPARLLCTVVHGKRVKQGHYHIGAEFTCVLNDEKVAPNAPAINDDRQRIQRSILD